MNYWLVKSEAESYSILDLEKEKLACWDGVRNYQARNYMQNDMQINDLVLFYHSNAKPSAIVGLAKVVSQAYPDPTQFDKDSKYFDPKASQEKPRWHMVDLEFVAKFSKVLSLNDLRKEKALENMPLLKKGMRLSVQTVKREEYELILKLAGALVGKEISPSSLKHDYQK